MGFLGGGGGEILDGSITSDKLADDILFSINKQQLEQNLNILINSASASALYNYDDMYLDIFSVANGHDGTVDIPNTSGIFDINIYKNDAPVGVLKDTNATETSSATNTYVLKKTLPNLNYKIDYCTNQFKSAAATSSCKYIYKYSDATQSTVIVSTGSTSYITQTYTNPNPTKIVESVEVWIKNNYTNTVSEKDDKTYLLVDPSNLTIQTNAQPITSNPVGHQVFCHYSVIGIGNLTYDISFDGGITWVTDQPINMKNISVHAGSSMVIKLNLNGEGVGNTVEISDYAAMLDY